MKEFTVKTSLLQELATFIIGFAMFLHSFYVHHSSFLWLMIGGVLFIVLALNNLYEIRRQGKNKRRK